MIYISYFFLTITIFLYIINLFLYLRAWFEHSESKVYIHNNPPISIIVPVYNEEVHIVDVIKSMLNQTYQNYNIIIVNDGSTDNTVQKIIDNFNLQIYICAPFRDTDNYKSVDGVYVGSGIILIDKANGGKSDALNAGFAYSNADYVLSVDGDTLLIPNCLDTIMFYKKPYADAVATMIGIGNDNIVTNSNIENPIIPKTFWAKVQWFEYYRKYVLLQESLIDKNCVTVISGACGLISSEMILKTGGYKHNHLGEDMELTLNIHKQGGYVQYLNKIVSWTEVPNNVKDLGKQRVRWFRGGFESYLGYTNLLFNKNNITFGFYFLPYIWFSSIIIPWVIVIGTVITLINLFYFNVGYNYTLWIIVFSLYYSNSLIAICYLKYKLKLYKKFNGLFFIMLFEGMTIHFLMIFWVIKAHILEFIGTKKSWNKLERKGFKNKSEKRLVA